jgi:hypothetical protein
MQCQRPPNQRCHDRNGPDLHGARDGARKKPRGVNMQRKIQMLRVVPARTPDHERDEPREKRHEDEHGARHPLDQGRAGAQNAPSSPAPQFGQVTSAFQRAAAAAR